MRLDASNRMVDLIGEDFDFAIRYGEPSPASYRDEELFADFLLPACTPEISSRHGLAAERKSLAEDARVRFACTRVELKIACNDPI